MAIYISNGKKRTQIPAQNIHRKTKKMIKPLVCPAPIKSCVNVIRIAEVDNITKLTNMYFFVLII